MQRATRHILIAGVCFGLASLGCASAVDTAVNKAVNKVGERVGEKVGNKVGEKVANAVVGLTPDLIHTYTVAVFQVFFYHGGYHMDSLNYKPGQYTLWKAENVEQGDEVERALLKRYKDGKEWWRIESRGKDKEGKPVVLIMEALLSPADKAGTRHIRRLRAHFPNEKEAREIPITEEQSARWTMRSTRQLTKESMEGMTVGTKKITTPAGTFTTKHLQVKNADQSAQDWFVSKDVPGEMVKYQHVSADKDPKNGWTVTLIKFGGDATKSKLGIDLSKEPGAGK